MAPRELAFLRDQPVLVLGLGAFGGGAGCAAALARLGAQVTVTDLRPASQLQEALAELAGLPIVYALGGHPPELFHGQLVVVNPAVPGAAPALALARQHGCELTSEINLALRAAAARPCLAVTGTHGKSTCAALAAYLLQAGGAAALLAGNLGGSLLRAVLDAPDGAALIVELSSFQTEALEAAPGWPRVAALTSLSADHLDRHGTLESYWQAKRRLLAFQDAGGYAVLPWDFPDRLRWLEQARGQILWTAAAPLPPGRSGWFLERGALVERHTEGLRPLAAAGDFPFHEPYRMPSLLTAVAGARLLGTPAAAVARGLRSFPGLPHRMETLPAPPGRTYIDNGVCTHPEPTEAALRDLGGGVVLCAGGYDKGLPLGALADACAAACREVHLSGPGGRRLAQECAPRGLAAHVHGSARAAMEAALLATRPGETLLFSPSFSSFDEFRNFRDRALLFRELCQNSAPPGSIAGRDNGPRAY